MKSRAVSKVCGRSEVSNQAVDQARVTSYARRADIGEVNRLWRGEILDA